jgi:methyl-accepting chemotaxis protein
VAVTTKYKIIFGFGIMLIVIAVISVFGVFELSSSAEGFATYRRAARINVATSNMSSETAEILRSLNAFLNDRNPERVDNALESLNNFQNIISEAGKLTQIEERRKALENLTRMSAPVKAKINEVRDTVLAVDSLYSDKLRPAYNELYKMLDELADYAQETANAPMLYQFTLIWKDVAQAVTSLGRFSQSLLRKDGAECMERIVALNNKFTTLRDTMILDKSRRKFDELMGVYSSMRRDLETMLATAAKKDAALDAVLTDARAIDTAVDEFSATTDKETTSVAQAIIDALDAAQKVMVGSSAAALVFGVLAALFIILGLVRVLGRLSAFAEAVAAGDFAYKVHITEKGEIGKVADAMRTIPAVLNDILETYSKLAYDIQYGKLLSQADDTRFHGGFATLIHGTNNIVSNLRNIIDDIPTPILLMNKETQAMYMNRRAMEVAGADGVGKTCRQLFNREDSDTPGDALKIAITAKSPASAETRCTPRGKTLDITYTALPILDGANNLTAVLQLITDLTAIKDTERTIKKVADQASGISGRVAAASEELSAQVEEVSRGAETQRTRVESTASAMSEMNSTVLEVARNAGQASEQSNLTRDKAKNGAELVNRVVQAINHVNSVAATLQNNMQELGAQAESIGGVMNVISDIADQTNLLALNAAIEAARAGEAGRGFAVVADEVRKLAEKTMTATQEVGNSIKAIQQSAKTNIEEVGSAVSSIGEATGLADSSGEALKEIVDLAAANSSVVTSIATAAEEQSSTSEEINRAIEEIHRIVNETSDGMVQSSSAVQELSHMAQELSRVMEQLTTKR